MKKKLRSWRWIIVLSCVVLCCDHQAFAGETNGTIRINSIGAYLVKASGQTVTPSPIPPAKPTNFLFFTSKPKPTAIANGINDQTITASSIIDGANTQYLYDFVGADGIGIWVLATSGIWYNRINTGKYYSTKIQNYNDGDIKLSSSNPQTYQLDFTLAYKKEPPPKPPIKAELSGYDKNLKPKISAWVIDADYSHPQHELDGGNVFRIIKTDSDNMPVDADFIAPLDTSTNGEFIIQAPNFAGIYWVRGAALNWWTLPDYGNVNWSEPVKVTLDPLPGVNVSHSLLLTFKRVNVTPTDPQSTNIGINSFSMPVAPANYAKYFADPVNNPAEWNAKSADDLVDLGIIRTAYDLVKAINKQVKEIDKTSIENVVSTFGEWKNDSMSEGGVLIANENPDVEPAKKELTDIKLKPGAGYQLYLTGVDEVKIRIKN